MAKIDFRELTKIFPGGTRAVDELNLEILRRNAPADLLEEEPRRRGGRHPVSYTHLTLPTICSV